MNEQTNKLAIVWAGNIVHFIYYPHSLPVLFECSLILVFSFYFIALTRQFLSSLSMFVCVCVCVCVLCLCHFWSFLLLIPFILYVFRSLMSWTLANKQLKSDITRLYCIKFLRARRLLFLFAHSFFVMFFLSFRPHMGMEFNQCVLSNFGACIKKLPSHKIKMAINKNK